MKFINDDIAGKIGALALIFDGVALHGGNMQISKKIKDFDFMVLTKIDSPFSKNIYLPIYNTCRIILPKLSKN